ncbi:MAG: putative O-methyltransferase [Solirubrobacterales bacterium]|nr:putative O-methyltransferase [Solirubrobacterales bacterium]
MRLRVTPDSVPEAVGLAVGLAPEPIFDSYVALMQARVLMVAWRVGIFDALEASGPADADALAARLNLTGDGLRVVLPALHALGYLEADGDVFRLSRKGRRTLTPDGRTAVTAWMDFSHDMWDAFDGLEDVLRGGPVQDIHGFAPDDPYWERYMRGLLQVSRLSAPDVARAIGAPRRRTRTILDVAGGHGGYAMALCRRHRRARATIVELEGAARAGRRIVAEEGYAARVEHVVADMLTGDLRRPAAGYDVALAANIVHHLDRPTAVALLTRMRQALAPGGRLAVFEQERPAPGQAGTQIGTLTGVLFHITSGARTCTAGELRGMFVDAGLREVRVRRLLRAPGQVLVLGRA